jgi:hypothetical protein
VAHPEIWQKILIPLIFSGPNPTTQATERVAPKPEPERGHRRNCGLCSAALPPPSALPLRSAPCVLRRKLAQLGRSALPSSPGSSSSQVSQAVGRIRARPATARRRRRRRTAPTVQPPAPSGSLAQQQVLAVCLCPLPTWFERICGSVHSLLNQFVISLSIIC